MSSVECAVPGADPPARRGRSRARTFVVGFLVSLVCVGLLLRQIDLAESLRTLRSLDGAILVLPLAIFLVNIPLRAKRWSMLFPAATPVGFGSCLSVLAIGSMANFLLPGRAGDLSRCVLVSRRTSLVESSRTLATLALEKILDGLAVVAIVLLSVYVLDPPGWVSSLAWVAGLVFGGGLAFVLVLRRRADVLLGALGKLLDRMGLQRLRLRLSDPLAAFAEGLSCLDTRAQSLRLVGMTAAIWMTEGALIWSLALAFGIDVPLRSATIVSAVLGLGLMIPAAPGGLGTYELAGTAAMKLVGLPGGSALALTMVVHAWVFLANVALGLVVLAIRGTSLAQLRADLGARRAKPPDA